MVDISSVLDKIKAFSENIATRVSNLGAVSLPCKGSFQTIPLPPPLVFLVGVLELPVLLSQDLI